MGRDTHTQLLDWFLSGKGGSVASALAGPSPGAIWTSGVKACAPWGNRASSPDTSPVLAQEAALGAPLGPALGPGA